ncbi:FAD-dependent oxidoreductase [Paenibacillus sp. GCM10023252]|uniref:FAD-dependent oxidoreductase n=1 Tax=Paenibacillus sp. GCM10023252 TaxID=3252649 RepID=UPI0036079D79
MTNNLSHYPVVVIGATYTGLGLASADPERVLVIERSASIGYEYTAAYQARPLNADANWSEPAQQLIASFRERDTISPDGRLHLPGMSPITFKWAKERALHLNLMTEVLAITPQSGGFKLVIYNASGRQELTAEQVIDTTSTCSSRPSYAKDSGCIRAKWLHAMLHPGSSEAPIPELGQEDASSIIRGRFDNEMIYRCQLELHDSWPAARQKLYEAWSQRSEQWRDWGIVAMADTFVYEVEPGRYQLEDGLVWVPSCGYDNLLTAFDTGIRYGEELKQHAIR